MEIKSTSLVIADISGYTRFLMLHTTSLLHAESIITDLLEAVIAQSEHPLSIAKLEGDAVFLYATVEGDPRVFARNVLKQVTGFFDAFRTKERELIACNTCGCPACRSIDKLHLKAVLHHGDVLFKKVGQFLELAGASVILIHRLLKNSVTAKNYILMTDTYYQLSGGLEEAREESRTEHADGLGEYGVKVYYLRENISLPPPAPASIPEPGTESAILYDRMNDYAGRRLSGLEPRRKFSSLPDTKLRWFSRLDYSFGRLIPRIVVPLSRLFVDKR